MKDATRGLLERAPKLYLGLLRIKRFRHWSAPWVVSRQTDICIEGFPRSANSYALSAFQRSQFRTVQLSIATHTHSPAQIIQAVRWRIPTMVCVRNPRDAVCGLLAFEREIAVRNGLTYQVPTSSDVRRVACRWAFFHRQILPFAKGYFVAPFEQIISDFETVSQQFLDRFQLDLEPFDPVRVDPAEVTGESFHVGPSRQRDRIKAEVREVIERFESDKTWMECDRMHDQIISRVSFTG